MKRFWILIFAFVIFQTFAKCYAQSQYSASLTKIEKSLYGIDYSNQSDEDRIKRIEVTIYGSASSSTIQQRYNKISKDLSADLIGQEIKPKADTFAEDEDGIKEAVVPKEDSSVNYPAVDNLEKTVFNKTFKSNDINQRLANLEQNVFKKSYNDDLNSRVDRLKTAIMPNKIAQNNDSDDDSYEFNDTNSNYSSSDIDDLLNSDKQNNLMGLRGQPSGFGANVPTYNKDNSVLDDYENNLDMDVAIGNLEKKVLKKTFPNDTISNRLLRMEVKVFNSTFTDDDEQTRYDRLASAYQAKKTSSKYDDNKFAKHAAAAMQIGAILLMILAAVL